MITPPLILKENESILLIALASDDAASRYTKIANSLKPFGFHVLEELGSCVLVSVAMSDPSELVPILIEILGRKDLVSVIGNADKGLSVRVILHRAEDDDEIRALADFWRPAWMGQ
jgi:hypothetical protein